MAATARLGPPFDHLALIVSNADGTGPWLAEAGLWQQTSPDSHFTGATICSRLTGQGRVSVSGGTLIRTSGGVRTEQQLHGAAEVLAAYRDHCGIILDQVPGR